ncbi:MAG TPA: carboxypeptidase regulatory-like domain-containing protein [Gemmatimonadaceae bacterium]
MAAEATRTGLRAHHDRVVRVAPRRRLHAILRRRNFALSGIEPPENVRIHFPILAAGLLLTSATSLAAQAPALGGVDGTLKERIATRSVRATVSLVQLASDATVSRSTRPDGQGRYHVDSLPPGRYLLQISTPTLDSLDLTMPAREVRIAGGRTVRTDAVLPFGSELRDMVCRSSRLGEGTVAVAGRVLDADTEKPLAGADVVATWTDVISDGLSKPKTKKRLVVAKTGAQGEYRLCGIPGGTTLALRLQHADKGTPFVRLTISPDEGVVVRDLSISPRSAPRVALLDSIARVAEPTRADSSPAALQLTGTASVTGIVRGVGAMPLAGVEVRVRDARSSTVTDSAGKFVLGALPAGTQILQARHDGYPLAEIVVELRPDRSAEQSVLMVHDLKPDSSELSSGSPQYKEFEAHRRAYGFGQFLDAEEVAQKGKAITETVDLFADMLGFTALGHGAEARLISNEALAAQPSCRSARIVAEGVDGFAINDIPPTQVGAIEAYSNSQFVPERYAGRAECGLVVIWMRKESPTRKGAGPTLRGNGYP